MNNINYYDAQLFLDRVFETTISAGDKNRDLAEIVAEWKSLNLASGSVVILLFPNSKEFLLHVFAIMLAGYVPALVSPATPIVRLNLLAKQLNAKAIIKSKLYENSVNNVVNMEKINGNDVAILDNNNSSFTSAGEFILTTSGSSDFSSGCVFDVAALLRNAEKHADVIGLSNHDTILVNLPLFYSYAFVAQTLAAYVKCARLVISSPPFNCATYISDIKKFNISVSSVTPLLVKELLSHGVQLPNCLRALTIGGDSIGVDYTKLLIARNPIKEIYLTYGITEAGPRVATLAAHAEPIDKFLSVGKPLPNTQVKLIEGTGELLIHSDTLVKKRIGSVGKPLFVTSDEKIWLRTGDIFSIDADGYLYFKNRISDFIVLNGEKVNLAAVKKFANEQPGVSSAKVSLIKSNAGLVGYDLNLIMQKNADNNVDSIKQDIRKGLKIVERPRNIEIARFGEGNIENYK